MWRKSGPLTQKPHFSTPPLPFPSLLMRALLALAALAALAAAGAAERTSVVLQVGRAGARGGDIFERGRPICAPRGHPPADTLSLSDPRAKRETTSAACLSVSD